MTRCMMMFKTFLVAVLISLIGCTQAPQKPPPVTVVESPAEEYTPPPVKECKYGELKQNDCNVCVCVNGFWKCTDRECSKEEIQWRDFTESVFNESIKNNLMIVVFVYAEWCSYCEMMSTTTFQDPQVVNIIKDHYIAVKVNGEQNKDIVDRFLDGKGGYPAMVFLYPDQQESKLRQVLTVSGYTDPDDFALLLSMVLAKQVEQNKTDGK